MTSCIRSNRALDNPPMLTACFLRPVTSAVDRRSGAASVGCATTVAGGTRAAEAAAVFKNVRRSSPDSRLVSFLFAVFLLIGLLRVLGHGRIEKRCDHREQPIRAVHERNMRDAGEHRELGTWEMGAAGDII